jgi:AcrR family transcriptional regulator
MPPKPKFSREQIVEAALAVASEQGPEALTAREVAKRLGCSTRPIFTVFEDMDELTSETRRTAARRIEERCRWAMEQTGNFVHSGVQIVRIALDEPNLFKLVFMTGDNLADSFDSLMASVQVLLSEGLDREAMARALNARDAIEALDRAMREVER